ncbi:hypothetical protein V1524DRAFT_443260 [Lipomyces starkeyi]
MDSSDGADNRRRKRQKVAIACDTCRSKKIKCDSVRPVCGPCSKRKGNVKRVSNCTWNNGESRGLQMSRAQVLKLQNRVRQLEEDANNQRSGGAAPQAADRGMTQDTREAGPEHALSQIRTPDDMAQIFERSSSDLLARTSQQPQIPHLFTPSSPVSSIPTGRSLRSPANPAGSGMSNQRV